MHKWVMGFLFLVVFLGTVSAEVALPPWSWNTYSGKQDWQVTVTEDQSGCDGPVLTNRYQVSINFNRETAEMGDVGHGPASGTFISGNILHIPGRTVDDPPGKSALSGYDIFFTTDCSAFAGKYGWDYSGPDGSCSGTTSLAGTNSRGCPASQAVPEVPAVAPASDSLAADIAKAQQDLTTLTDLQYAQDVNELDSRFSDQLAASDGMSSDARRSRITDLSRQTENELQAILSKDSSNYDANIGMAELRKSQHQYDEYNRYLDAAMAGRDARNAANDLQMYIARKGNFATWPTRSNSGAVSEAGSEIPPLIRNVLGHDFSNVYSDSKDAVKAYLYATFCERSCDYLANAAHEAASTGGGGTP